MSENSGFSDPAEKLHLPQPNQSFGCDPVASTQGNIADILMARGQLDEALRIRTEEELPVYERLGDVHSLIITRWKIALAMARRGRPRDAAEASRLLLWSHGEARRLRLPFAEQIEAGMRSLGLAIPAKPPGNQASAIVAEPSLR